MRLPFEFFKLGLRHGNELIQTSPVRVGNGRRSIKYHGNEALPHEWSTNVLHKPRVSFVDVAEAFHPRPKLHVFSFNPQWRKWCCFLAQHFVMRPVVYGLHSLPSKPYPFLFTQSNYFMIYRPIMSNTNRNFCTFCTTWLERANRRATFKTIKLNQCKIMSRFFSVFPANFSVGHRAKLA